MRLRCDIETNSRFLPALNMRSKVKAAHASVKIGYKKSSDRDSLCILVSTAQNLQGTTYLVKSNIDHVFNRFACEGKATIRFKNPAHDLIIKKADPVQLKMFLQTLKMGLLNKQIDTSRFSTLKSARLSQIEGPKTKLIISERKNYPTMSPFPPSLTELRINRCVLQKIENRILNLKNLVVLDLSDNVIENLPKTLLQSPTLKELHLSNNKLREFSESLCENHLCKSLSLLDLSHNHIKFLPRSFCKLKSLVTLKINNNSLSRLHHQFGSLSKLKFFSAAGNLMQTLPGSIISLKMESIDVSDNPFNRPTGEILSDKLCLPSLLECAANAIVTNRIEFDGSDIPKNLSFFLDSGHRCPCGILCFRSHIFAIVPVELKCCSASVTTLNRSGSGTAPLEMFFCSLRCYMKYRKSGWII